MDKVKIGVIGTGSIAQVVHLPILSKLEDVELVAICDIDDTKIKVLSEKFHIPRWYYLIDNMMKHEKLDAIHICTPSVFHYPMAFLALKNGVNVFVEKPISLTYQEAEKLHDLAETNGLTVMVGMQNRFRDDVAILKDFIDNDELGDIYYIKAGWLKKWAKAPERGWYEKKDSGGGVMIDMGIQLIDLGLYLTNLPEIYSVRLYDYALTPDLEVEEAALAVIKTKSGLTLTIEVSWKMHLDHDINYTHIFGKKGSAYLNPLRINKELHGNLVNVTPMLTEDKAIRYKKSYEAEISHFINVIKGEEENMSSSEDAMYIMKIINALSESASTNKEIFL
jgi:predicted dehydrogenase